MKRSTLTSQVIALAASVLLAPTLHATNYKLIVISGQSNSGDWSYWGEGPFPAGVKEWINDPACDALVLTDNGDASAADESLVTMYQQQSVEGSQGYAQTVAYFADQYWKAIDPTSKIVVVKKSVGATSLDYWIGGGRNGNNPYADGTAPYGLYYAPEGAGHASLFSRIQRAKSLLAGSPVEGAGFFWYQGEGNAGDTSGYYIRNILDLLNGAKMVHDPIQPSWGDDPNVDFTNGIRQELDNPDMPLIVTRISSEFIGWGSNFGPPNWEPGRQVTRADQVNATRELSPAAFIDVDDRPVNDGYHYLGADYSVIGGRFAAAWKQLTDSPVIRPERTVFTGSGQEVTISAPPGGATVFYTLDGSTPTAGSTVYSAPFTLNHSATVKAVAYRGGVAVGPVVEKRFTKLAALPAQTPSATAPGVRVRAYLPENAAIFPGFETAAAPFNPSAITQSRISRGLLANYGWSVLHCTAYINIPQDDVYEFQVTSGEWRAPDPSYRILINDTPVERYVALKAGLHAFRFDKRPPNGVLVLQIKGGPYTDFTLLAPEIYSHETTGGNPVSFEVSRLAVNLPAAAGSIESVFVTSDVTSWTAASDQGWLTVSPGAGAFHEKLALTAQANTTGSPRTATVTLSGAGATTRTFTVTQAASDTAPLEAVVASAAQGATTTLAITAAGAWSLANESNAWFDCIPSSGTGNATVTIRAQKNDLTTERIAWVQVDTGGPTAQRVRVRQSGDPAFLSASTTAITLADAANANPVNLDSVLVRSNINWTASTSTPWLNVNAAAQQSLNGSSNGRIWLLANQANPDAQPREGTVTLTAAGLPSQNITVIQPGTAPFLAANPSAVVVNRGDAATFHIASNQASWDGNSDQSWLTVSKAATPKLFILKATPNTTGVKRMANVTITSGTAAPIVVPVTQNAAGKFLAFNHGPGTLGAGANQSATVLVDADEDWSVTSVSAPWLAASAGLPVANAMTGPLLREHTPGLAPATERRLRRLHLSAASANDTGAGRQAEVVLTSTSGATINATVTQSSNVLSLDTSSLPNGTVNAAYSQSLQRSGGESPFTWTVTGGSLPAGLTLSTGGVISGTPTTQGTSNFTVTVTDLTTATASRALSITVDLEPAIPPTITSVSLLGGTQGFAYSQSLASTGGVAPLTWTVSSGTLPAGLTLNSAGVISGNPSSTGTSNFTVLVTDSLNATDTQVFSLVISAPVVSDAIYEGFNYNAGSDLNAQAQPAQFGGWKAGTAPGITSSAGSLSYTNGGTLATAGNKISGGNWQTTGMGINFSNSAWNPYKVSVPNQWGGTAPAIGQGTMYVSFLMQSTAGNEAALGLYTGDTNAGVFSQLAIGTAVRVTAGGEVTLRVASYNPAGTNFDQVAQDGTTGASHTVQNALLSVAANSVNFYVLKIEFGATTDTVSLFVNPAVGGSEGTPSATITTPAGEALIFRSLAVFLGYNANANFADEIRLAGTWADAVPPVAPVLTGFAAWADTYGLPTDGTGDGSPTAILAGDGITNLMKYALGIDPDIAGYQSHLTTGTVNVSGSDYLSLTYTRPEPAPTGVTYTPQACSDLAAWSGNGTVEVSSPASGGLRTITVRDGTAVSAAPRRFLRLKVTAP
ncbi:MAG: BACON domain-containing carbohydrate-binding protein [Verrucomicrobia bacterium]|nr:BACON domain-containing carbohydrate-binding protein [Verrucomicrobiota bacterium]